MISLAFNLPPTPAAGFVVVSVKSPSMLELPETSNLEVGLFAIPKLPPDDRTA